MRESNPNGRDASPSTDGSEELVRPGPPKEAPRLRPLPVRAPRAAGSLAALGLMLTALGSFYVAQDALRRTVAEASLGAPSEASLARAVFLEPSSSLAWLRLGRWHARNGADPAAAAADLQRAVSARPYDAFARMELGLQLERAGDLAGAERQLLQAARLDLGFEPRWTLANFHLRGGDSEQFWDRIRDAVSADPDGLDMAMALCWRAFDDPAAILERGVPNEPEINRRYFDFLTGTDRLDALRGAWPRFLTAARPEEVELIGRFLDRLLAAGEVEPAVEAWNQAVEAKLLPHSPLEIGVKMMTNGTLMMEPLDMGFDWRRLKQRGVEWELRDVERLRRAIEFRFTGAQDDGIVLMRQYLPVLAAHRYRFNFEYATQQMPAEPGIGWVVVDVYGNSILRGFDQLDVAENFWDGTGFEFETGPATRLVSLELRYRSKPGVERTRGRFVTRSLSFEAVQGD